MKCEEFPEYIKYNRSFLLWYKNIYYFAQNTWKVRQVNFIDKRNENWCMFLDVVFLSWQVISYLGDTPDVIQCCPEIQSLIPLRSDEFMC